MVSEGAVERLQRISKAVTSPGFLGHGVGGEDIKFLIEQVAAAQTLAHERLMASKTAEVALGVALAGGSKPGRYFGLLEAAEMMETTARRFALQPDRTVDGKILIQAARGIRAYASQLRSDESKSEPSEPVGAVEPGA